MPGTPGYVTQQQAYQALLQAGASPDVALVLAAVTRPESSGYTAATNNYQGNQYLGLWQIGSFHGFDNNRLRSDDILYQAQAALQVYHEQGFQAWETYTNGTYKQYLDQTPNALALSKVNALTYANTQQQSQTQPGPTSVGPPRNPILGPEENNSTPIDGPGGQPSPVDGPTGGSALGAPGGFGQGSVLGG